MEQDVVSNQQTLSILVLEDSPLDAELAITALTQAGYECRWDRVETGEEFIARLDAEPYDLILSDYNLPTFDGMTALKTFQGRGHEAPFILVSGAIGEEKAIEILKAGATDYVLKDRLSRLVPVVQRALREKDERQLRRGTEEALRESEEKYRLLFENAPVGIAVSSPDGRIETLNDHLVKMMKAPSREVALAVDLRGVYVNPDESIRLLQRLDVDGVVRDYETTLRCLDNTAIPVSMTMNRITIDGRGALFTVFQDITERKRAEEALRREKDFIGTLVNTSPAFFVAIGGDGKTIMMNQAMLDALGYRSEEVVGTDYMKVFVPESDHKELGVVFRQLTNMKDPTCNNNRILARDGRQLLVEWHGRPVFRGEEFDYFFGVGIDITERTRAEEQLLREKQRFQIMTEQAPFGVVMIDDKGSYVYANPKFSELFGYTLADVPDGRTWFRKAYPDREHRRRVIRAWIESTSDMPKTRMRQRIFPVSCKDGTEKNIGYRAVVLGEGETRYMVFMEDVTERYRARKELERSEETARAIINATTDSITLLDGNGIILNLNEAAAKRAKVGMHEAIGASVFLLSESPEVEQRRRTRVKEVVLAKRPLYYEDERQGTWYHTCLYPIIENGAVTMVAIYGRDITAHRLAENAVRFQAQIIDQIHDGVISTDLKGHVTSWNTGAEGLFQYTKDEVRARHISFVYPPEEYDRLEKGISDSIRGRETYSTEVRAVRKDGTQLFVQVSFSRLSDESGELKGIIAYHMDITKSKELEEQLRQSQKMEAIGQLAGGIAHDFNNLLTVIQGYSEVALLKTRNEDPLTEHFTKISEAAGRAAGLTHQLLAFSRRQVMESKVIDLNVSVENLHGMLKRVIGEDIELGTIPGRDLWRVKADPRQIEQMIINFAVNARDAMPTGGKLTIETANAHLDNSYTADHVDVVPGPYVMLCVSDTGTGMPPEVVERVFEPFFTTKEKGKGTGLGLSMVYGTVKQSGGAISVYSEVGRGTVFRVYLPRSTGSNEGIERKTEPAQTPRGNETVLLVEDDDAVRELSVRILAMHGYQVLEAASPKEAIRLAQGHEQTIDMVLTDIVMPQMSGKELVDRLRQSLPNLKLLYMSGYTNQTITHHGVLEEGTFFLQKPFTVDGLAKKVREVLDSPSP